MREELPVNKNPGNSLKASHVNALSSHYNKFERIHIGPFLNGHHNGSSIGISGTPNDLIAIAQITDLKITNNNVENDGLYKIQLRWFRPSTGTWGTDTNQDWILDERGINTPPTYSVGDLLIVYWDDTRGAFVPASGAVSGGIYEGKLDADLAYNDTTGVTVSIWSGNPQVDTGDNVDNVLPLMVMTSGTLSEGDPVVIQKISGRWRVTHAEC